jgi:PKD repeat protein
MSYSTYPPYCGTFTYGEVEDYTAQIAGNVPVPPVAAFSASTTTVVVGGSVTFTDQSTNNPTSWSWSFEGGTPATSTAQNPTITYNTVGTFDVTLTAANSAGSDAELKTDYITVTSAPADEIAEAVDYPTITFTKSGNGLWYKVTDVYYYGGDSARTGPLAATSPPPLKPALPWAPPRPLNFTGKFPRKPVMIT